MVLALAHWEITCEETRLALIRSKNLAYIRLEAAHLAICKRARRGPVPGGWLVRLAVLEREYQAAIEAVGAARGDRL